MTVTDPLKTIYNKIKLNQAQYDVDRLAAKILHYRLVCQKNMNILGYRPSVGEQAKFEYFPLGKGFNKRLNKSDKKDGLSKRLKNIDGKN